MTLPFSDEPPNKNTDTEEHCQRDEEERGVNSHITAVDRPTAAPHIMDLNCPVHLKTGP